MLSKKSPQKLLIGVTGGIGSGKSLVCKYFSDLGGQIFYADQIAKNLYFTNHKLKQALVKQYGKIILDEKRNISFDNLRRIVYSSDANQKRVNKIVHPFVINEILLQIKSSKSSLIFIEAALIFESAFNKYLDYTIEVFAPSVKRISWVWKRSRLHKSQIKSIIKLQMPEKEKVNRADFVIRNNSSKAALRKSVNFIYDLFNKKINT